MILAENIVNAYVSRSHAESWAAWANKNPIMEKVLMEAEILCQQLNP